MKYRRIMIAAPKSGSGKTMITCLLLEALKNKGEKVASCKCGPDYIDPMFHEQVMGVPARNLDTFFTGEEQTRRLFSHMAQEDGITVLEGAMGIFDGLGGVREEGSSYYLAQVTGTPVIFVVDAKGMGRSLIPMLAGFLAYDKAHLLRGVILNRISKGYYEIIGPLIERELGVPVLGYVPESKEMQVGSRYLGLVMPDELEDIRGKLKAASEQFIKTVSIEKVMEAAGSAGTLAVGMGKTGRKTVKKTTVIAVARDEAFCFYYADNLRLLEEYGAEIRYFSPLEDGCLPDKCCGILIGGGYPELYAGRLSRNQRMHECIRQAVKDGMPVVAECGGFMYLHSRLVDKEGACHPMAGVIPAKCFYTGRLVRFGYVEVQEKQSCFLPMGERIKGHEFHYYDSTDNGEDALAIKPVSGKSYSCIMEGENYWMGFPHLYYPSNAAFARKFVEKAGRFSRNVGD